MAPVPVIPLFRPQIGWFGMFLYLVRAYGHELTHLCGIQTVNVKCQYGRVAHQSLPRPASALPFPDIYPEARSAGRSWSRWCLIDAAWSRLGKQPRVFLPRPETERKAFAIRFRVHPGP